jgi:hypothetical protein
MRLSPAVKREAEENWYDGRTLLVVIWLRQVFWGLNVLIDIG